MHPPLTRDDFLAKVKNVQRESDPSKLQQQWTEILNDIHQQAIFLPLWGTRIPYVVSRRLTDFTPSPQAFSYPLESVRIVEGSANVTIAPGAGGSLFESVGPMNPHQYFPNQLFAQAWLYEGLVAYGQDGEILPALATQWSTEEIEGGGQRVTFVLRDNVTFHDGAAWNCAAAKLNFDHVLSDIVRERHGYMGLTAILKSWSCTDAGEFVLETSEPFYPLLQELTYIRPLTFASPNAFAQGLDSHPDQHNSCNPGDFGSSWTHLEEEVTCAGLKYPAGTGPFKYVSRVTNDDGKDTQVVFARHDTYWGTVPGIENLIIQAYDSTEDVEAALLDGTLDMALGVGPLTAKQVQALKFSHSDVLDVRHSDVLQHALVVMNTGKSPTDEIAVRRAITHGIDKNTFIQNEFAGLEQPVAQLLPFTAPYCNVDLSPKWSYDFEKAQLINCPVESDNSLSSGAIAGIAIGGLAFVALLMFVVRLVQAEKQGKPVFAPSTKGESNM
jgi:ABC-type transport system substrate-binding protein